jgi:hypothetical protein
MKGYIKNMVFLYLSGPVSRKNCLIYVAFVGFQHFLDKLRKTRGQETPFSKTALRGVTVVVLKVLSNEN